MSARDGPRTDPGGAGRGRAAHGRRAALGLPARRRHHHAAADRAARVLRRRPRGRATGKDPIDTYKAIFDGTGLNWFFPWISEEDRTLAALNLQQTLIVTTPLILTGLAVAFAFRCGLFNIGGQGQYLVGSYIAMWIGISFESMPSLLAHPAVHRRGVRGGRGVGRDRRRC